NMSPMCQIHYDQLPQDFQETFLRELTAFYRELHKGLEKWTDIDSGKLSYDWMIWLEKLNWIDLYESFDENKVIDSLEFWFEQHGDKVDIEFDKHKLRRELPLVKQTIDKLIPEWTEIEAKYHYRKSPIKYLTADIRWVNVFQ